MLLSEVFHLLQSLFYNNLLSCIKTISLPLQSSFLSSSLPSSYNRRRLSPGLHRHGKIPLAGTQGIPCVPSFMGRRLALILTLTAWLFATGSHWDLVQTFGWGRMIAAYSKTMPLAEAIRLTFTTDNVCSICVARPGREASRQRCHSAGWSARDEGAAGLPTGALRRRLRSRQHVMALGGELRVSSLGRSSPPTPPPRGA
jgi:hypothetical protein